MGRCVFFSPNDAVVQHCPEYLESEDPPYSEVELSARSVVQFEGVPPETATCLAYAPVDLEGQVSVVVDAPPPPSHPKYAGSFVWVVSLTGYLYVEYGGGLRGLRHPLRA